MATRHIRDGGRSINIKAIGSVMAVSGGSYDFGKQGVVAQLCRVFACEIAPRGIAVDLVSPGFVETTMLQDLLTDVDRKVLHKTDPTRARRVRLDRC